MALCTKKFQQTNRIPDKLREKVFEHLFETAEIAKFSSEQLNSYEDSSKTTEI